MWVRRRYLVGLVGSSSGNLALVAGSEFGEVTVVVTLPVQEVSSPKYRDNQLGRTHIL